MAHLLHEHDIPANGLILEITETVVLSEAQVVDEVQRDPGGAALTSCKDDIVSTVPEDRGDICTEIDLKKKRIVVDLPEGLDDLDHVED